MAFYRTTDGGAVSECWIGFDELRDCVGDDAAVAMCAHCGGVSVYVPRLPVPRHALAGVLGTAAFQKLCLLYGGMRITVPNRRRDTSLKGEILRRLGEEVNPRDIAVSMGVTERYVRMLAREWRKPQQQCSLL